MIEVAEVAVREADQEQPELHHDRPVEPELGVDPRDVGSRARSPRKVAVGSPGSSRTSTKAATVIRISVGMICRMRERIRPANVPPPCRDRPYFSSEVAAKMLLPSGIWTKPFTCFCSATG